MILSLVAYFVILCPFWVREGRYSYALQALSSQDVAGYDDESAYKDLLLATPLQHVQIWVARYG